MTFRKDTLFLQEEVKRGVLSFLDSNFFLPIVFARMDAYTENEQTLLKPIQKQLTEVRAQLLDKKASVMLKDLDKQVAEWRSLDPLLTELGLPTTKATMGKMLLMGRFADEPIPALHYWFGFLQTKKSG